MIRLLLVIPTLDRSGAEKQLTLLATGLPRSEFDVKVVALSRSGPYESHLARAGIDLTVLHKRLRCDPAAWWRLRRLIQLTAPDVLHTWLFAANAYGRLAAGGRPPFRVVVSERCVDTWKSAWQLRLDRLLAARTDRMVANSAAVADFYRGAGFPSERLTVIHNGVEVANLPAPGRDQIRDELRLPRQALVVGYVGRLARQKRVDDLIWAFELIRVMQGEVFFVVAGDGPEKSRLQAFARDLAIDSRVSFLGHREDALRLLPALDLFWLASGFEGLSNSLMEAMAAGLPVVASDIPPNRELVVHGQTGYLVPVGDRVALAQFAQKLLLEPELARQFGAAGRGRISESFGISRMVEAYARLYHELVDR